MIDLDAPPDQEAVEPSAIGLKLSLLDDETAAGLRVLAAPSTGLGCHGRGGCCSLYDRLRLAPADAGRIAQAYGDEITPGGLSVESALFRERGDEEVFGLAVTAGTCVLVEADGACGVHRRLGATGKPAGCHAYPLRDVKCDGELHVGLAVECRCAVDFSGADPATLARAAAGRAGGAPADSHHRGGRRAEVAARARPRGAARRVCRLAPPRSPGGWPGADDVLRWAGDEARALGADVRRREYLEPLAKLAGVPRPPTPRSTTTKTTCSAAMVRLGPTPPLRNLVTHEASTRRWRVSRLRGRAAALAHARPAALAQRAPMGLTALALRLQLARAGGAVPMPPELLPVSSVGISRPGLRPRPNLRLLKLPLAQGTGAAARRDTMTQLNDDSGLQRNAACKLLGWSDRVQIARFDAFCGAVRRAYALHTPKGVLRIYRFFDGSWSRRRPHSVVRPRVDKHAHGGTSQQRRGRRK